MSSPVDVLAVMDGTCFFLRTNVGMAPGWRSSELAQARAAVAELIEAGKALQEAMDTPENGPFDSLTVKQFHEADARHRAALARVQGGAE